MDDFEQELKLGFLEEANDLMVEVESAFLRLESERDDPDLINQIFRLAHNLKGTSKAVGFDQLSEVTHIAENLILKIKQNEIPISDEVVNVLLEFKDYVTIFIEVLKNDTEAALDVHSICQKLEKCTTTDQGVQSLSEVVPVNIDLPPEEGTFSNNSPNKILKNDEVAALPNDKISEESADNQAECDVTDPEQDHPHQQKNTTPQKKSNDESIRVKLSRVNALNNIVGELVILQTVISQRRNLAIQDEIAKKSILQMDKLMKEVQELSMSLRMLPLKSTFQKMSRIVRDTSKILNKKVELKLMGEDTEVDKTVLEKLSDPLVHIVRNAVDHAIEPPEERTKAGKSETGEVQILAFHESSNLVIEVIDNGRGISPETIFEKAITKGIIDARQEISENQVLQLLFHPGFSTKEQVTEVSGRGVGLDVVKSNIENLGGEVSISSQWGEGSIFRITLPLTLAIIDGIVVRSGNDKFVIPLSQVFELTTFPRSKLSKFSNGGEFFRLRGDFIPVFDLNKKLGLSLSEEKKIIAVLIRGETSLFAVRVDDVLHQQQIVVKKLGSEVKNTGGLMGSSIMGDGKPAIILDILQLFQQDIQLFKSDLHLNKEYQKLFSEKETEH